MVRSQEFVAVIFTLLIVCSERVCSWPSNPKAIRIPNEGLQSSWDGPNVESSQRTLIQRRSDQIQNDVPQPGEQTQNITSAAGVNDTHVQSGVITNDNTTYPESDCRNLRTGRDNKCWEELHLTDWVRNWIATHQCYPEEPFARCFMRLEEFYALDCTGIKLDACTPPQGESLGVQVEVFYVAFNIYAINQFFLSWWTAVGDSGQTASLNIDQIVQIVDVPDNTNLIMDNILIALTGIFALAPVGLTAVRGAVNFGTRVAAGMQLVENALFAYPQIGRYLFPHGDTDSKLVQIAALKTELVSVLQEVQNNLNKTLCSVMSNIDEFLAFASLGNFSSTPPSLPDQANYLLYGFNTYLVSAALAGNDVHAVLALDTNPQQLATNGTALNYDIGCEGFNEVGVCGQWWWDPESNIAYGLDDFRHMNRDMNEALTQILSNYTTGELLFRNAYMCNLNGNYGTPVNVTVNAAGISTSCLSQLQTLRWDMRCRETNTRSQCEFLDAPPQNTWMDDCGSHSYFSVMDEEKYCVPKSYLGPLITQKKVELVTS